MKVVLANGCFDPLHAGHVQHLLAAREMGDHLIVALTTDESVRREKGDGRPFMPWAERAAVLHALRVVDRVIPSESGHDAVRTVVPDIFVKGIDYADQLLDDRLRRVCAAFAVEIRLTRTRKLSSTRLLDELAAAGAR